MEPPSAAGLGDPEKGPRRRRSHILLGLVATVLVGTIVALGLALWRGAGRSGDRPHIRISPAGGLFDPDPEVGLRSKPGSYDVELVGADERTLHRFHLTIGPDGYRPTERAPRQGESLPEVWVFGGSFTLGWMVDDRETYPWLLQAGLRNARVRNLGQNAFGTVHALLQLEQELGADTPPPRIAVFQYITDHIDRNVAAPSFLAAFRVGGSTAYERSRARELMDRTRFPRGSLGHDGALRVEMVPLLEDDQGSDPDRATGVAVTRAIFQRLGGICRERGITGVVLFLGDGDTAAMERHAGEHGFVVVSSPVDVYSPEYTFDPLDGHPNARAHRAFADALQPVLQRLLEVH